MTLISECWQEFDVFTYFEHNEPLSYFTFCTCCTLMKLICLSMEMLRVSLWSFTAYARIFLVLPLHKSIKCHDLSLNFGLEKKTILVSIKIKICSKDELGQWDSMRACFSHSIWNKTCLTCDKEGYDIVKLWREMITSFSCFLEKKKSVHGLLEKN